MVVDWRTLPSEWRDLPGGTSGVYFLVEGETVAYIGKSKCLRGRLKTHFYTKTELRANRWHVRFYACTVEESASTERECIQSYVPPLNIIHRPKDATPPAVDISSVLGSVSEPKSWKKRAEDNRPNVAKALCAWRHQNALTLEEAASGMGLTAEEQGAAEKLGFPGISGSAAARLMKALFLPG